VPYKTGCIVHLPKIVPYKAACILHWPEIVR